MFKRVLFAISGLTLSVGTSLQASTNFELDRDNAQEINLCDPKVHVSVKGSGWMQRVYVEVQDTSKIDQNNNWIYLCVKAPNGHVLDSLTLGEGSWLNGTFSMQVNMLQHNAILNLFETRNSLKSESSE